MASVHAYDSGAAWTVKSSSEMVASWPNTDDSITLGDTTVKCAAARTSIGDSRKTATVIDTSTIQLYILRGGSSAATPVAPKTSPVETTPFGTSRLTGDRIKDLQRSANQWLRDRKASRTKFAVRHQHNALSCRYNVLESCLPEERGAHLDLNRAVDHFKDYFESSKGNGLLWLAGMPCSGIITLCWILFCEPERAEANKYRPIWLMGNPGGMVIDNASGLESVHSWNAQDGGRSKQMTGFLNCTWEELLQGWNSVPSRTARAVEPLTNRRSGGRLFPTDPYVLFRGDANRVLSETVSLRSFDGNSHQRPSGGLLWAAGFRNGGPWTTPQPMDPEMEMKDHSRRSKPD